MLIFSNTYLVDNQCIYIKNKGRSWYDKQHIRMGVKYHVCIPSSATSGRGKGHFPCSLNIHGIVLEVALICFELSSSSYCSHFLSLSRSHGIALNNQLPRCCPNLFNRNSSDAAAPFLLELAAWLISSCGQQGLAASAPSSLLS